MQNRFLNGVAGVLILTLFFMVGFAGKSRPKSTLRVYIQTVDQAVGGQSMPVGLMNPDKTILVRRMPELSEFDIAKVETGESDVGISLRLTLTEHGKIVLNAATLQNQGKILVIFVNGRVVYSPVIDKVLADGVLIIPRGIVPEEVQPLRDAIKESRK